MCRSPRSSLFWNKMRIAGWTGWGLFLLQQAPWPKFSRVLKLRLHFSFPSPRAESLPVLHLTQSLSPSPSKSTFKPHRALGGSVILKACLGVMGRKVIVNMKY